MAGKTPGAGRSSPKKGKAPKRPAFADLVLFDPKEPRQRKPFMISDRDGQIGKSVSARRHSEEFIGVATGDRARFLKALSDDAVDFVIPDLDRLRIDASCARMAKRNGCHIALSLSGIIGSENVSRALRKATEAIETLEYYNAPVLFATFARDGLETRREKELESLLEWLGAERPKDAVFAAARILKANRKRKGQIAPGIAVVPDGKEEAWTAK